MEILVVQTLNSYTFYVIHFTFQDMYRDTDMFKKIYICIVLRSLMDYTLGPFGKFHMNVYNILLTRYYKIIHSWTYYKTISHYKIFSRICNEPKSGKARPEFKPKVCSFLALQSCASYSESHISQIWNEHITAYLFLHCCED